VRRRPPQHQDRSGRRDPADGGKSTVHTKLMLVDDVFASIGSANFFSRSMVGTDSELSCTFVTTGPSVKDLRRVRLWAEHLRTPLNGQVVPALEDLDTALGIWRIEWLPADGQRTPGAVPDRRQALRRPNGSWCPRDTPADHLQVVERTAPVRCPRA
jgi:phosphatidylserine/phosphatidylglycerophosphate/cardiolipin synthase-like enzyme